jgi:ABC-2 type transport system permease protein
MIARPSQIWLFQWLRLRLLHNSIGGLWHAMPVRLFSILVMGLLIWIGLFVTSFLGFGFLHTNRIPSFGSIVGTIFDFLFLALAILLIFSSGIILYSSLFASAETAFLLTTPAREDQIFGYKFQGAVVFSSWAILLLGTPILIAYGVVFAVSWYFFALLPLFLIGFVILPGAMGALLCLLIVSFIPQRRKQLLVSAVVVVVAFFGLWVYRAHYALHVELLNRDIVQQLYGQIAFARGTLMPSHWMTRGLQAAARGDLAEAGFRLTLIWSNALFVYLVAAWLARRLYRRGYDRMATGGDLRRRYGGAWLDHILSGLVWFLNRQTRLLIVKDFRAFRRDPAQWAQVAIFTSLLVLYFGNTQRFFQEQFSKTYQNGISLLNLFSVALLMCAYVGRFIYPLLSLEGRKFWILGLVPMERERLLWGKFVFALLSTVVVAELLIVVSDLGLGMPPLPTGLHALAVLVLALGLSGLSVGLGALLPNFRESDPSKIAIGFGGTLSLVACLLYLILVIALMAMPWHFTAALDIDVEFDDVPLDGLMVAGATAGCIVGILAVVLPIWCGARALRRMEF